MGGRGTLLKGLCQVRLQRSRALQAYSYISSRAMSSRLFVGGLSFTTEEEGLRTAFSKHGEVVDARIVVDRESGRSRGFGFVTYLSEGDADGAKDKMNGQWLDGRVIRVDKATPRPPPPSPPPRLNVPPPDEPPNPQDWGTIPSPIAAVPQNAGLVQSPGAEDLPSLSSLASSSSPPSPITGSVPPPSPFPPITSPPPPPPPPVEPARPTFNFNFDLSTPDPNYVPRPRPPRIRPSMMDYEFGLFSDTSKFPFNTNFGTGFLKVKGPEADFDFSDIKEALALKKAEELAAKQEAEAAAAKEEEAKAAVAAAAAKEEEAEAAVAAAAAKEEEAEAAAAKEEEAEGAAAVEAKTPEEAAGDGKASGEGAAAAEAKTAEEAAGDGKSAEEGAVSTKESVPQIASEL
ncbi:hypothetical protein L7F22_026115 [Adiantum nelumboides]|nr:hypothetical protein [Adiantum nelumboides]